MPDNTSGERQSTVDQVKRFLAAVKCELFAALETHCEKWTSLVEQEMVKPLVRAELLEGSMIEVVRC